MLQGVEGAWRQPDTAPPFPSAHQAPTAAGRGRGGGSRPCGYSGGSAGKGCMILTSHWNKDRLLLDLRVSPRAWHFSLLSGAPGCRAGRCSIAAWIASCCFKTETGVRGFTENESLRATACPSSQDGECPNPPLQTCREARAQRSGGSRPPVATAGDTTGPLPAQSG